MSNTTVLQVRLDPKVKSQATEYAKNLGYSSLQEVVRIFLNTFAFRQVKPGIVTTGKAEQFPSEYINLGAKAKQRWAQILKDADRHQNMYSFDEPEEALDFLLSDERES